MFVDCTTKLYLDNYDKKLWFIDYAEILDINNLPGETWRDVGVAKGIDFKEEYKTSNLGRIKSCKYSKEKIMRQSKSIKGYRYVGLTKNGKQYIIKTHNLVALAFIPNDDLVNKTEINHIDENKLNNCVENLEWCTHKDNMNYGTRTQRQSEALKEKYAAGWKSEDIKSVIQLSIFGDFIKKYSSAKEASKHGFSKKNIWECCNCRTKTHKGYIWMYESEYTEENVKKRIEFTLLRENMKSVVQLGLNGKHIKTWRCIADASRNGFNECHIEQCCKGKIKTHKGYKWMYLEDYNTI